MYVEHQRNEQRKWKLWPKHHQNKSFDELLANEYIDREQRRTNLNTRLSNIVRYCESVVPYYQSVLKERDIQSSAITAIEGLGLLPIIDRAIVKDECDNLQSLRLPANQSIFGFASTSGSTGQPVKVLHTKQSMALFGILKQREYRSWGYSPDETMAVVRPASDLPRPNGKQLEAKATYKLGGWQYVNHYFKTGEMVMVPDTSGTDFIVEWLEQNPSRYIMAMAAVLEQIALGYVNSSHKSTLQSALSISQQLTNGMRDLIQKNVAADVRQNYGLNEIGLVAMQCTESDQFHVHNENCLIEIVNEQGQKCEPGTPGKLLVSGLVNYAMPLLRYDTDDLAEFPIEACPCGRTMQSFINLQGRYRRTAHLPVGTWDYWDALLRVFGQASAEEMDPIKQYQLHQLSADEFHLKLKVSHSINDTLRNRIETKWQTVAPASPAALTIFELDKIAQPGKKFQNFISDISPQD